ncbi:Protein disulfide isomerase (prolyl 4-hydroxylase beta subunit) [Trachipleistophora hominis]|uniref:Protein disulfide isomerase (Prolyl 4-hydroxylase beta subunit) n=1 Tax=Trachipleistophora hominis TaxID=72359 RepID=L7JWD0_TRAHO|nr:Protein disulfide isomerase (prolyl 4-hydroxylase beta subunit) [Trachipleistophora hominis]
MMRKMIAFAILSLVVARVAVRGDFSEEEMTSLRQTADVKQTKDERPVIEDKGVAIQVDKEDVQDMAECVQSALQMPSDMKSIAAELEKKRNEALIDQVRAGKRTFFIFFADQITNEQKQQIMKVKEDDIPYFISSDKKLAKSLGASFPGVYAFNTTENVSYRINIDHAFGTVMAPVLSVLTSDAIRHIDESKLPAFYIFYTGTQDKQLRDEIKSVATDLRDKYKFGMLRYIPGRTDLNHFKVTEEQMPALVHLIEGKKYRLVNVTRDALVQFIGEYAKGQLTPFVRSEPVPQEQTDLVKVVGTTHNDFVSDDRRDTFIVYGSETCPHCVSLLPTIEKLAARTKDNTKVKVGYINLYENDVPDVNIKAFPTIMLYAAGKKEPIEYKDFNRTEENFISFIKENGSLGVDLAKTGQNVSEEDVKDEAAKKDLEKKIEEVKSEIKEKVEAVKEEL